MADLLSRLRGRVRGDGPEGFLRHVWALGAAVRPPADAPRLAITGGADAPDAVDAPDAPDALWRGALRDGERLAPHALAVIAAALAAHPKAARAYTETVRLGGDDRPAEIELKPSHDPLFDAARPYAGELALHRVGADPDGPVLHIPYPALITPHPPAQGSFALPAPAHWPRVSVIIPSRDAPALIRTVLAGLYEGTDYPALEVIVSDNGSTDAATLAEYAQRMAQGLRVIRHEAPFNFAAQVNRGVAAATGDALLLLNNDIEIRAPGWLREMVACLAWPGTGTGTGIIGARLLFPDGRLQHAGAIIGLGQGYAGHWFAGASADAPGPVQRLLHRGRLSAVTAAAMLIDRACWEALGGMDAETFAVAYNDVDFCLRAEAAGFATLWTPHATLIHHESATRRIAGAADRARFRAEKAALRARHGTDRLQDPALSPWLSREILPRPRRLAALPAARLGWAG
ncbi:MAG: glycosyltransferase family 2 protein [Pseudomonadota bacterium]